MHLRSDSRLPRDLHPAAGIAHFGFMLAPLPRSAPAPSPEAQAHRHVIDSPKLIAALVEHVKVAERAVVSGLEDDVDDRLDYEDLTELFFNELCSSVHDTVTGETLWLADVMMFDRDADAQESVADVHVLVDVELENSRFLCGFLAIAVLLDHSDDLEDDGRGSLVNRCEQMLKRSAMSFVLLYAASGPLKLVSAASVVSAPRAHLQDLASWTPTEFFSAIFKGFAGDPSLTSALEKRRKQIIDSVGADFTVFLNGRDKALWDQQSLPSPRYGPKPPRTSWRDMPRRAQKRSDRPAE